jgi:hypothetical protein
VNVLQRQREQQQSEHQRREWLHRLPLRQRLHAVIDIDAAADEKDADGGHQRPEVFFLSATERMRGVGPARAANFADFQQYLVGDVGDRVDRLGEQRR